MKKKKKKKRGEKMPRPGPRPYECVRRAWHSDRHQPMRSSIVQQIFKYYFKSILCILFFFSLLLFYWFLNLNV